MTPLTSPVGQCRHLLSQLDRLAADLDESHVALQPLPGAKTAGWLLGHLAVTGDFALRLCGHQPLCPPSWRTLFNPGTHPLRDPSAYPSVAELRDAAHAVYAQLCAAALDADPALLMIENPYTPARTAFPTAGDFVGYMVSGHLAYHLGQLVAWRAAAGIGSGKGANADPSPALS